VRAFNPWPIAEARWQGQIVRIWEAQAIQGKAPIGIVAAATPAGIDVGTTDGLLRITKLQLPNRRAISALDFINAHNLIGATFE
jgi:methionyl-tRNA formyltransferase